MQYSKRETHSLQLNCWDSLLEVGGYTGEEGIEAPIVAEVSDRDRPYCRRREYLQPWDIHLYIRINTKLM